MRTSATRSPIPVVGVKTQRVLVPVEQGWGPVVAGTRRRATRDGPWEPWQTGKWTGTGSW